MADQESRDDNNGTPGVGEVNSVMRVNLAEGERAVNDETPRMLYRSVLNVRR
jgi:hypothetical protein